MTDVALRTNPSRWRRLGDRMAPPLWLLVAGLAAAQAIIWVEPTTPSLAVLEQFAVQLAGLGVLGTILGLVLRRWVRAALLAVVAMTLAWPVFAARAPTAVATDATRLKVVSANLWVAADGYRRTIDTLMATDADIIGLVEVSTAWQRALVPLIAKYPYKVDCFATVPECETILLSKLPIVQPRAERVFGVAPVIAGGTVDWNGRTITVLATHLIWPFARNYEPEMSVVADPDLAPYLKGALPAARQTWQAGNLAKFLNTLPPDVVVMGDFNGASWSRLQRAFRTSTGLDNAAGWDFTWPANLPKFLRLSIDHVLSRGHLVVTRFEAGPRTDSDHLPVIAEIGWRD